MRIKKKDAVIPFRETMAYRLLLATGSLIVFIFAGYFLLHYIQVGNKVGIIVSVAGVVMAITSLFYNLGEVKNAKVPASAMKRARRR